MCLYLALASLPLCAQVQPANPYSLPPAPATTCPCDDGGYWIISARHLDGELGCSRCQHFAVWRYSCDGQGRVATISEFLASLSPQLPVCFMMHGSFVDWETVRQDSWQTNRWLRSGAPHMPVHVVFFTWPSDDTPRIWLPIDVHILGRRAARHGFYVAELISMIPNDHPISLVGHSHGARMVASTLHVLGGGQVENVAFQGGPYQQHRLRAVFAAAAFDHNWLNPGQIYDHAIHRPEGILNLMNRRDLALGFYPLHRPLTTTAAAARSGFTDRDRARIGGLHEKIVDYDITPRVRRGHIWPHYYSDSGIAQVIAPYALFADRPAMISATEPAETHVASQVSHNTRD